MAFLLLFIGLLSPLPAKTPDAVLVVGEKISSSVGFYAPDGTRTAGVAVGKHPHELALSADGRHVYVSDNGILWMTEPGEGGNTISIIDIGQRRKVGVIDLDRYRRPHGLAVDAHSGRLVVTIENPDGLLLVDPVQRRVIRYYDTQGRAPHMVALDAQGEWAYVSNTASGTVAAIHLGSGDTRLIPSEGRPQGGVFSADGSRLYVTNSEGHSISIIDTAQKKRLRVISTGKGPGRIVVTPDGRQLIYNLQADNAVGFADIAAEKETIRIPLEGPPLSLSLSRDGKTAYSGVQSLDKVYAVSVAEGRIVRSFNTPKESGPDAVLEVPAR